MKNLKNYITEKYNDTDSIKMQLMQDINCDDIEITTDKNKNYHIKVIEFVGIENDNIIIPENVFFDSFVLIDNYINTGDIIKLCTKEKVFYVPELMTARNGKCYEELSFYASTLKGIDKVIFEKPFDKNSVTEISFLGKDKIDIIFNTIFDVNVTVNNKNATAIIEKNNKFNAESNLFCKEVINK